MSIFDSIKGKKRFVMCRPEYLDNKIPNNVFMEKGAKVDVKRACQQWDRSVHMMRALGMDVLEIPPVKGCQDQAYVANIGIAIKPYIVLANYKAEGRPCEVAPARKFFEEQGYNCVVPPFNFEGEADLKKLNEKTYFAGHGKFSDIRAQRWIAEKTGIEIIPVREVSDKLYHLDCSLFVVDEQNVIVSEEGLADQSIKAIEKVANITFSPKNHGGTGITNGVLIPDKKVYLSGTFNPEDKEYRTAMEWLMTTMDKFGIVVGLLDCDAYNVSGADLSCTVFHLDF